MLECEREETKLRCAVCVKFRASISSRRKFSPKWILGAESIRSSNIGDHAKADQHVTAMNLLKRERARLSGSEPSSYSPIVGALHQLQESDQVQLRHNFDIAYFTAIKRYLSVCIQDCVN